MVKVAVDASGNFALRLRDQAGSTGYSWQLQKSKTVTLVQTERKPALLPGAPAAVVMYLHASRVPSSFNLVLKRPWESHSVRSIRVQLVRAS